MSSSALPTSSATSSVSQEPRPGGRPARPTVGPAAGPVAGSAPARSASTGTASAGAAPSSQRAEVHEAIQILQEKWVLHIVHALLGRPSGFNELGRAVGGCNPSTLAQRLQRLEALGLVRKEADERRDRSARGRYVLTPAGEALRDVIDAIGGWASDHLLHERGDN